MDGLTENKKASLAMEVFASGGEMGELMRTHDWSKSLLGPVENWPQSLKTSIRIILGSRYPMFVWWGQELLNFYNDAYIPVLGRRHPKALGESAPDIWSELWHSVGPFAEDVLYKGNPSWNEEFLEIMERNGYPEETYFTFSYSPISNDDGGVGGIFCACTEDTKRVLDDRRLRTLRELGAETAKAKTVAEACNISTSVLANNLKDIPFALIYLLERERQLAQVASTTNLAVGTLASPSKIELTTATKSADCWSLNTVLATGETQVIQDLVEKFGPLPGGEWSESPKTASALPLTGAGQEILGFLIVGISPLRPFDDDYKGFCELVAGQVTTAIANAQAYEQERKRAEALAELDQAKTAFFSNVSHEFRTPLTLLINPLSDVLAEKHGQLLPQQREQLAIAQRNSLRLLKLVNTLLDFSRIEAGRIQAVYQPTDLAVFTAELASIFRSVIETAGLQLIVDCPSLSDRVYIDREMWEKIVLNLISNAFKFTLTGEIAVSLHQIDDQVELKVRDTGTGILSEELPRIFERFHRVRGVQARSHEGSGIGLALVQELVHLHGGTIDVNSTSGVGSCFTVTIPLGTAHLPSDCLHRVVGDRTTAARTQTSTALGTAPYVQEAERWLPQQSRGSEEKINNSLSAPASPASPAHILLVDDNADMRDYLTRILSEHDIEVEAIADGEAALAAATGRVPDLVLSDVMMPNLDGFELLKALRADARTKEVPIILLSARAGEESIIEGLQLGADDYLIKPFRATEVVTRVLAHLQLAQLRLEALHQERTISRRKNEVLSTVSHELNTPLVAILGWTRLLRSSPPSQAMLMKSLETIERNATLQAKLVQDLLDISRITAGKISLNQEPVELQKVIEAALVTVRQSLETKAIRLNCLLDPLPRIVQGDPDRLQQIILNLLTNAVKFTPEGGRIEVSLLPDENQAEIILSDTGCGISADFLPYIFDTFCQADGVKKGLGLGLAIARNLVELHGGTIHAQSPGVGQGTTFTVRLPLCLSH